jgi:hypothetical protein
MTDDELHSGLVRWLAERTGKTVIKSHQSGDRPALPYLMVNLTTIRELREHVPGTEYAEDEDSGRIMAAPLVETEWQFSVHAFGPNPTALLRPIRSAAHLAQANEPLMPGAVIHEVSQIRNVPEWVNKAWEPRAQMDLFLRGMVRDGHLIDVIEEHSFTFQRV